MLLWHLYVLNVLGPEVQWLRDFLFYREISDEAGRKEYEYRQERGDNMTGNEQYMRHAIELAKAGIGKVEY